MIPRIKIEQPGMGVTAQDCGRTKYRALGVPLSGALDPVQLAAANALAGAAEDSAALEILLAAPSFRVEQGPLRVGLAGALSGMLTRADGMCAAYPLDSPGGWRLIGRTPAPLFDPRNPDHPALLTPGDKLRWRPIDRAAFERLERQWADTFSLDALQAPT